MKQFLPYILVTVAVLSMTRVAAAQATCTCTEEEKRNCSALGQICSASGGGGACQKKCVDAGANATAGDQCQEHGFGCGSCVADGVWGALWINTDCSRRCDKVCGNVPATDSRISVIARKSGPELVPAATPVSTRSQAQSGGFTNADFRPSRDSSHDSAWCGVFGPSSAEIMCPLPQIAHCWCDPSAGGLWGIAKCECKAGPATPATQPSPAVNCSIPRRNLACPAAGLSSVTDPGCATNCVPGYKGVCRESTCIGNTWTQSICQCVPR